MRSRSGKLTSPAAAALLAGMVAMSGAISAGAQGKPAGTAKPAAAVPAPNAKKPAVHEKKDAGKEAVAAKTVEKGDAAKKEEAKKLFKDGDAKFDAGDYAGALLSYREADTLIPGAAPKYKAALSLDKLGKTAEAIAGYQAFLDSSPDAEKFKDKIADSKTRIEALKKTPATVKLAVAPAAAGNVQVSVDGAAQTGTQLSLAPGKHVITVTAEGYEPATQEVDVVFAEVRDIPVTLAAKAKPVAAAPIAAAPVAEPAQQEPAAPKEPKSRVPAYVTLGLAGVGAGVGTIFGVKALGAKSDFDSAPTTDNADNADRYALLADMSFAIALTFGVTGLVLLLDDDSAESAKSAASPKAVTKREATITPVVGPKGGGLAAKLTF